MELRQYWRIVWDRRLLVLGVTLVALVAAILSVAALPQPLPSYQATVQLGVRPPAIWRGPFGRQVEVGRGDRFLAAGGMDSHAAVSSSVGSGDGAAQPRRNSRKPKCEIFFLNMILLILYLSAGFDQG